MADLDPFKKPACKGCGRESLVYCQTHKLSFCGLCAVGHEMTWKGEAGCVWSAALPLRMLARPQLELKLR